MTEVGAEAVAAEAAAAASESGERTSASRRLPRVRGFAEWPGGGSPKEEGKALRKRVPRAEHAVFDLDASRPGAVAAVEESNLGRLTELTPIRVGRMAATPFAFLRGSAGLMAYDLARTPMTRIRAQICGDAHAANFGLYGDARGGLVIDLNDFDETQATRHLAGARGPGGGRRRGQVPQGRARHRRFLPAHHASAGQAPGAGRVERDRGRGAGLPHRRP
jgi:uncharacterized protein DUF2252